MPSEKILKEKKAIVADLAERIKKSCVGVLVDYRGITVADDTKLRRELREAGTLYCVTKNTMLIRAFEQAEIEGVDEVLKGTTALATSENDYVAAARILCNFADENDDFFTIKAGFIEGKIVDKLSVEKLAKLPSKEILVAMVLGTLNAPIVGFVSVLSGVLRSLVIVISAIEKSRAEES
ncbi:MAG: 50S ribosomal protein L10 [Oscillospiraceae bacterium]|jgi:large subunit ribosomal protein L10|nr:50S ribosomal protein L10 [Oscillospiraceae bacterium]